MLPLESARERVFAIRRVASRTRRPRFCQVPRMLGCYTYEAVTGLLRYSVILNLCPGTVYEIECGSF